MAVDLNKVKNEGVAFQINKLTRELPNTAQAITFWIGNYLLPREGEDIATATNDILRADPNLIEMYASRGQAKHESALIKEVSKGYKEVLKNTDAEYVTFVAEHFIGDKKYKDLRKAVESGQGIKKAFTNFYAESELWKEIVALASDDAIKTAATAQITRTKSKDLTDKLGTNEKFDMEKGASYDAKEVGKLKENEKNSFYENAGLKYTTIKIQNTPEAVYFAKAA